MREGGRCVHVGVNVMGRGHGDGEWPVSPHGHLTVFSPVARGDPGSSRWRRGRGLRAGHCGGGVASGRSQ